MKKDIEIREITKSNIANVSRLADDARGYGEEFVRKAVDEWKRGVNTFDKSGEVLLGAFDGQICAAICGLNIDPYANDSKVGRLRRMYVSPDFRGKGIATMLVKTIIAHARQHFDKVRLYTECPIASRFYESMGFVQVDESKATHAIKIFD